MSLPTGSEHPKESLQENKSVPVTHDTQKNGNGHADAVVSSKPAKSVANVESAKTVIRSATDGVSFGGTNTGQFGIGSKVDLFAEAEENDEDDKQNYIHIRIQRKHC
jgi:hypothetical protein